MKKLLSVFLLLVLFVFVIPFATAADLETTNATLNESQRQNSSIPVDVHAETAILMDAETGQVLIDKDANVKMPPASITKIMTILLVMEAIDSGKISVDDVVTVSEEAAHKGGSQIWLEVGEKMSVNDLLKSVIISSANDASTALAEYISGSELAFVDLMNTRAKQLNMKNTHFENCSGLDDETTNHMTTAYDIALMARELLLHQRVLEYTMVWMDSLREGKTKLTNTNKLLKTFDGITGLKTGTTQKAGYCVCATAKREGMHLIAVLLNDESSKRRFSDAAAMLNWGFSNYTFAKLKINSENIFPVKVLHGEELSLLPTFLEPSPILVKKEEKIKITQNIELSKDVHAPVEKGQILGKIQFLLNDRIISEVKLCAPKKVEKISFSSACRKIWTKMLLN